MSTQLLNQFERNLIDNHHKLLQQLEINYVDHINKLLTQKNIIIHHLQQQLSQQMHKIKAICSNRLQPTNQNNYTQIRVNIAAIPASIPLFENNQTPIIKAKVHSLTKTKKVQKSKRPSFKEKKSIKSSTKSTSSKTKKFECLECGKLFTTSSGRATHARIHSKELPFKCPKDGCNKRFRLKISLNKHVNNGCNDAAKPHKCIHAECNKHFVTNKKMVHHFEMVHSGKKPFVCSHDGCNKAFATKHLLKQHENTHSNVKPFKCAICKKSFLRRAGLEQHERIHSGEKSFVCEWNGCKKRFRTKSNLLEHMSRHKGKRDHECSECGKTFVTKCDLAHHLRKHKEKKFECPICNKKFRRRDYVKEHIKNIHK